jgi:hypothetical protein
VKELIENFVQFIKKLFMLSWNMKVWKMCQVAVNKNDDNKAAYFFILRYFSTFNVSGRINFPV